MHAADIMTRPLVTIDAGATLTEAIDLMLARGFSALPVVDKAGHGVGVLSQSDLLVRAELETGAVDNEFWSRFSHTKSAEAYARLHGRRVGDVMTPLVCCVAPDTAMPEIVREMRGRGVRRLYVAQDGALIGVVSERDVMRALRNVLQEPETSLQDSQIEQRLLAQLKAANWAPRDVTPEVRNGRVIWRGVARDTADIAALKAMAEAIPGVTSVQDALFLLSPGSGYSRPEES